jgi:hypothetical protein
MSKRQDTQTSHVMCICATDGSTTYAAHQEKTTCGEHKMLFERTYIDYSSLSTSMASSPLCLQATCKRAVSLENTNGQAIQRQHLAVRTQRLRWWCVRALVAPPDLGSLFELTAAARDELSRGLTPHLLVPCGLLALQPGAVATQGALPLQVRVRCEHHAVMIHQ